MQFPKQSNILVTGAGGNASMNFIKSLRKVSPINKYLISGTDQNQYHLACSPAHRKHLLDPKSLWIDQILKIVKDDKIDFIHPQTDRELFLASENRESFSGKLFIPSEKTIRLCRDKLALNEHLAVNKISVPTSVPFSKLNFLSFNGSKVWIRAIIGAGSRAALPILNYNQAEEWVNYWNTRDGLTAKDFMFCEFLPGREFAFQSIWYDGKLRVSYARERIEYMFGSIMPSRQSSSPSVAKSVHDSRVNKLSCKAVLAADSSPHGVYCVDIKEDSDGEPCVTEINAGRFFTTSDFGVAAGCNMPEIFLDLALNGDKHAGKFTGLEFNAIEAGLYWIRGIDREPILLRQEPLNYLTGQN